MDTIRKVGDSLAGRYFLYRLHPFDIKEACPFLTPDQSLDRLLRVGGYPEPFLENDDKKNGERNSRSRSGFDEAQL